MKKIFTLLALIPFITNAQILVENFTYTAGTPLTDNGWIVTAASTTNPVSVITPGLTYAGYSGSAIGNAVALTTTGQDVYRDCSGIITSGSVYASFMLNVATAQATGDYFFAFTTSTNTTGYVARVHVKSSGAGFVIGLAKASDATTTYGTTVYSFATTYLVVAKYTFVGVSASDDIATLYAFSSGVPATEPLTAQVGPVTSAGADASNISRVALRQGNASNAPGLTIDGIRVADGWYNAPLPVSLKSFNASLLNKQASLSWSTSNEINVNGFDIERSNDGNTFKNVGFVAANNTPTSTYSFTDVVNINAPTYYRLKMIDKDGSFKYSSTVVLNGKASIKLDIFPNPVTNTVIVSHVKAGTNNTIKIITVDGRNIITQNVQVGATQTTVDLSKLIKGNYLVVFENEGTRSSVQIVKQ